MMFSVQDFLSYKNEIRDIKVLNSLDLTVIIYWYKCTAVGTSVFFTIIINLFGNR